jgi:hypothetical protein
LNINGMCYFKGFEKKVIDKIPDEPLIKIDFMENLLWIGNYGFYIGFWSHLKN